MYFVNMVKEKYGNDEVCMFVDMDGVITDYNFGENLDFEKKRPLLSNIRVFKELSKLPNVSLFILSICKKDKEIAIKNEWLYRYCPFFENDKRFVISKESHPQVSSRELKYHFLKDFAKKNKNKKLIIIDDDNGILKYLSEQDEAFILYQDSSIVD